MALLDLSNHVAIITGGASGIGEACARLFSQQGARVIIADRNAAQGKAVADSIDGAYFRATDVTQATEVQALMEWTATTFGQLDILVNNAGIDGAQAPAAASEEVNWHAVVDVNQHATYYGIKYGLQSMLPRKSGTILNMASVCGLRGVRNIPAYAAAKAAVVHLTRSVALEYAEQGIRINALCPSVTATPLLEHYIRSADDPEQTQASLNNLNPMPGLIPREAVAEAALFLCSPQAAWITGVALPVDGGYTAK